MKVTVSVAVDTEDPRYRRLIRLMEDLGGEPHAEPDRGDAWEPPAEGPSPRAGRNGNGHGTEDPPTDGRQLLGWAAKQKPDQKGIILAFGKKKGLKSRITDWTAEQVKAAYDHARRAQWGGNPR